MDVKQRNDDVEALRQQVEALTARIERALTEIGRAQRRAKSDVEWDTWERAYALLDDDYIPYIPAPSDPPADPEAWRTARGSLPVLDPMACAERDTTPLTWPKGGEGK